MDLTSAIEPKISFDYWLCEFPPNQYEGLSVWLTNGVDTFLLEQITNDTIAGSWQSKNYDNLPLQAPFDQVRFMVSATDTTSGVGDYTLKVHIDNFKLSQSGLSTGEILASGKYFKVYPNPVTGSTIYMTPQSKLVGEVTTVKILDVHGRILSTNAIPSGQKEINIDHTLQNGMYYIQWFTDKGEAGVEKVTIMK
jgi:hypothetical protein